VAAGTYGIKGFPTLKLFSNGAPKDYEGERTSLAMIQWIKKRPDPLPELLLLKKKENPFSKSPLLE